MSKTLTEMAAEIIAARVRHEAMTGKEIENCINSTFEALQKLKERENNIPENAVQEQTETPEQVTQAKEEPEESAVKKPIEKPAVQAKKGTILSTILNLIKSNPKGVDTNYITEETDFNKNQVRGAIRNAKKSGTIKTTKRGIYVSV